jgi:glutathione synthase/RimK-type ligase-like ATP-grasp enzyme
VTYVGLLCNCSATANPMDQLSASLVNRAILIDELLEAAGIKLFLYSPRDVVSLDEVPGYTLDNRRMVPAARPVPRINANWTYGTRKLIDKGMGYRRFKRLLEENHVGVYVSYAFCELVSNKRKTYDVVRKQDDALHPHTEDFARSSVQIESFLERSDLVFLKPRAGNRGNKIFVLRREDGDCALKYYDNGKQQLFAPLTVEAALGVVDVAAGDKQYIIQHGIDSLQYEGAVFDVRVVMVHDGSRWHSILETRLAPPGSDLSNVFQGGSVQATEDLFSVMFGDEVARETAAEIRRVSHRVAEHFESLFPDDLMEIGFDFVLDQERKAHLVEVNSKPGVAGFGSEAKIFDWKPEDEPWYEKWVYPHVRHLAGYLRSKVENPHA